MQNESSESIRKDRLRLWVRLLTSSRLIEETVRRKLRSELGSTLPRFDVMSALDQSSEGLKMSEISSRLRVSNGNITGIVDKLSAEGLAERVAIPGDRRAHLVRLTAKGRDTFVEHSAAHEDWVDHILQGLNADDVDGMIRRLDHLIHALEEDI